MKRQLQILGFALGFISLAGGLIDIGVQYYQGDSADWRIPIFLIGFGIGLPLCIIPFFDWPSQSGSHIELSEQEYAQNNLNGGLLSSNYEGSSGGETGDFESSGGE